MLYYKNVLRILDQLKNMEQAKVPAEYMLMHMAKLQSALKRLKQYQKKIKSTNIDLTNKIQQHINKNI